jgi:hypothetical protein
MSNEVVHVFSLTDGDSYKSNIGHDVSSIYIRFVNVINEYFIHCVEKLQTGDAMIQTCETNAEFNFKNILRCGYKSLLYIYRVLLLYTRNLDLAYYHTQKSIYYYMEFIDQILLEPNAFLKLTPYDAVLFVYKKTIFQLNQQHKSLFIEVQDDKDKLATFDCLANIYRKIVDSNIHHYVFTTSPLATSSSSVPNVEFIKKISTNIVSINEALIILVESSLSVSDIATKTTNIILFIDEMSKYCCIDACNQHIVQFIKRIIKETCSPHAINANCSDSSMVRIKFHELSPLKFVSWICSPPNDSQSLPFILDPHLQ